MLNRKTRRAIFALVTVLVALIAVSAAVIFARDAGDRRQADGLEVVLSTPEPSQPPSPFAALAPTPEPSPAENTREASAIVSTAPFLQPSPTLEPSPSPSAKQAATATPAKANAQKSAENAGGKPLSGKVIGLDPGHQQHSNSGLEPVAPGSSDMKKMVSSGTRGRFSGVYEHEVNLAVGLLLQSKLKAAGATVVMTREKADVNITNVERAELFNEKKVDLGLRLHCNGSNDAAVHGAFMLVPSKNPFKDDCTRAAKAILAAYGEETGIGVKKGLTYRSDQTGFNWCERPVVNIEMGHMTNKEEDIKLTDKDFQKKMAEGLYKGILNYFSG